MPAPTDLSRTRLLVVLGALSAFGPLCFDMYLPGLPRLTEDLGASQAGGQLSLSLCMLGLGLGQVVVGPLSDQLGRKPPMVAGVLLFTVACFACALTPNLPFLLVARILAGFGGGAGAVIARSMVRDLFEGQDAAHAYGVTALVFGIAPVVAPLLGALLISTVGWRGIFVALGLCGIVLTTVASRLPETLPPQKRQVGGLRSLFSAFPAILRDRSFLLPAFTLGLGFLPLNIYLSMSSYVLQTHFGLSAQLFGAVFAVNSIGIWLAGRLNLRLIRTVHPYWLLGMSVASTLVGSALVLLAALADAPVLVLLAPLFLALAACGPMVPNATTLALDQQGDSVGAAAACLGLVQTLFSSSVAPVITAIVGVSPVVMGAAMTVCSLVVLAPMLAIPRPHSARLS